MCNAVCHCSTRHPVFSTLLAFFLSVYCTFALCPTPVLTNSVHSISVPSTVLQYFLQNALLLLLMSCYFCDLFTILLLGLIIYLPYHKIAAILKYLCIVMLVYFVVPFLYKQDVSQILKATFIPTQNRNCN